MSYYLLTIKFSIYNLHIEILRFCLCFFGIEVCVDNYSQTVSFKVMWLLGKMKLWWTWHGLNFFIFGLNCYIFYLYISALHCFLFVSLLLLFLYLWTFLTANHTDTVVLLLLQSWWCYWLLFFSWSNNKYCNAGRGIAK